MITKQIVKDYVIKSCPYLTYLESNEKKLLKLIEELLQMKKSGELFNREDEGDSGNGEGEGESKEFLDIPTLVKEHPDLKSEIEQLINSVEENEVDRLIATYDDQQLIARLSRRYFELMYGKENCLRCDLDDLGNEVISQTFIVEKTKKALANKNIQVIFEGQIELDDLRARFDVLIRNENDTFDLYEVKGTNDVFDHPKKDQVINRDIDSKIQKKYLYDLLFQHHIYQLKGLPLRSVGYMTTNRDFVLQKDTFPIADSDLTNLFVLKEEIHLKSGTVPIIEYFNNGDYFKADKKSTIPEMTMVIDEIRKVISAPALKPEKRYRCRKGPACPFIESCFPEVKNNHDSIFALTNWNLYGGNHYTMSQLMDVEQVELISEIKDTFVDEKYPTQKTNKDTGEIKNLNARLQIDMAKGNITNKFAISHAFIREILERDYINDKIEYLVFFDFESFQYPIPLVFDSKPWKQVVCQYSMHIVHKDYDLRQHDFTLGKGGKITHYEFIGNPDMDKFNNPSIKLYETLLSHLKEEGIDPMGHNYQVIVFNQNFEVTRMKEFIKEFDGLVDSKLIQFVSNFKNRVVDLLDFFTRGAIYCRDFVGRGSLKKVQPVLTEDKDVIDFYKKLGLKFDLVDSLDYKNGGKALVQNGSVCLDLYKTLLIRSNLKENDIGPKTEDLLKEALAYCKIDSWGTVIIFDILKNVHKGKLSLDLYNLDKSNQ